MSMCNICHSMTCNLKEGKLYCSRLYCQGRPYFWFQLATWVQHGQANDCGLHHGKKMHDPLMKWVTLSNYELLANHLYMYTWWGTYTKLEWGRMIDFFFFFFGNLDVIDDECVLGICCEKCFVTVGAAKPNEVLALLHWWSNGHCQTYNTNYPFPATSGQGIVHVLFCGQSALYSYKSHSQYWC